MLDLRSHTCARVKEVLKVWSSFFFSCSDSCPVCCLYIALLIVMSRNVESYLSSISLHGEVLLLLVRICDHSGSFCYLNSSRSSLISSKQSFSIFLFLYEFKQETKGNINLSWFSDRKIWEVSNTLLILFIKMSIYQRGDGIRQLMESNVPGLKIPGPDPSNLSSK